MVLSWYPQILADQLTLAQTGGKIMLSTLQYLAPADFQTLLRPCSIITYGVTLKVRDFERFSKFERAIKKLIWFMPKLKYILNPNSNVGFYKFL